MPNSIFKCELRLNLKQTAAAQLKEVGVYSDSSLQPPFKEVTKMMTEDELDVFINELLEGDTNDS